MSPALSGGFLTTGPPGKSVCFPALKSFLPLSQNVDNIPKDLGTRHRAGIGVTETIDVMSIIVSEETGIISIARAGKITRYADIEMLKKTLTRYYWQELDSARR